MIEGLRSLARECGAEGGENGGHWVHLFSGQALLASWREGKEELKILVENFFLGLNIV